MATRARGGLRMWNRRSDQGVTLRARKAKWRKPRWRRLYKRPANGRTDP